MSSGTLTQLISSGAADYYLTTEAISSNSTCGSTSMCNLNPLAHKQFVCVNYKCEEYDPSQHQHITSIHASLDQCMKQCGLKK